MTRKPFKNVITFVYKVYVDMPIEIKVKDFDYETISFAKPFRNQKSANEYINKEHYTSEIEDEIDDRKSSIYDQMEVEVNQPIEGANTRLGAIDVDELSDQDISVFLEDNPTYELAYQNTLTTFDGVSETIQSGKKKVFVATHEKQSEVA